MFQRILLFLALSRTSGAIRVSGVQANLAPEAIDPSQKLLDELLISDCTMDVDLKAKTIKVKYPGGDLTLSEKGMNGNDDTDSIIPEGKGLVCEINNTNLHPETFEGKHAMGIFTQATSTKYIFHNDEEEVWPGFANKLCYARKHGYRFFMWFGNLPNATLETLKNNRDADALPCQDTKKLTIHYLRSIGMAAVMRNNPLMPWLVQMDIQDQIVAPMHFDKAFDQNFLHPSNTDIVAAAPHYGVFLNAGAIAFKNSEWSRDFMMKWFKNRCGGKDQLSLWHSLFTEWVKEGHDFKYEPALLDNYHTGLPHALEAASFFAGGQPLQHYNRTHELQATVKLPHLTILPNAGAGCRGLDDKPKLCMRFSDSGDMPFFWSGSTCKHVWGKEGEECNPMNQVCKTPELCQCW